jgi:hypothetical protein
VKSKFVGKIVLKGLAAGKTYRIVDYVNDKIIATDVTSDNNEINVELDKSLLIKADPR